MGCVDVVVVRVYPLLCMEKMEGRRNVFRSERAEARVGASHEAARQRELEKICAKVQREFEDEVEAQGMGGGGHVVARLHVCIIMVWGWVDLSVVLWCEEIVDNIMYT